jgi:hypothetical protein
MKLNWLVCILLTGILVATTQQAVFSVMAVGVADTEAELHLRGMTAGVTVFLVWFFNLGVFSMLASFLPVHPFLRQSLVFFKKRINAWLILYLSLWVYCFGYAFVGEWPLAIGCGIAALIVWEKLTFPWEFYKAHVEEYEGHLEKSKKESNESLDNDDKDR